MNILQNDLGENGQSPTFINHRWGASQNTRRPPRRSSSDLPTPQGTEFSLAKLTGAAVFESWTLVLGLQGARADALGRMNGGPPSRGRENSI
jgi:hypothetical protein